MIKKKKRINVMTYDYFPRVNFDENCIFERGYRVVDNTLITKKKKKNKRRKEEIWREKYEKKIFLQEVIVRCSREKNMVYFFNTHDGVHKTKMRLHWCKRWCNKRKRKYTNMRWILKLIERIDLNEM